MGKRASDKRASHLAVFLLALPALAYGQGKPLAFEVATIRQMDPRAPQYMGIKVVPGGRVVISGFSLKGLICTAFDVSFWQLTGGEEWTGKVTYVVEGAAPEEMRASLMNTRHSLFTIGDERLRQMLQALLIERFQLQFHRDVKPGTVYQLERNLKGPLLMSPTNRPASDGAVAGEPAGSIGWAERWVFTNTTMQQLAKFASDIYLHKPVTDRTELTGPFEYRSPPEDTETYQADPTGSFLNMIRATGLKLEASKGDVETFVIDRAVQPSAN